MPVHRERHARDGGRGRDDDRYRFPTDSGLGNRRDNQGRRHRRFYAECGSRSVGGDWRVRHADLHQRRRHASTGAVLPAGLYFLRASGSSGYLGQIYTSKDCGQSCGPPTTGTPVSVGRSCDHPGGQLQVGPRRRNRRDRESGIVRRPIANARVDVYGSTAARSGRSTRIPRANTPRPPRCSRPAPTSCRRPVHGSFQQIYPSVACDRMVPSVGTGGGVTVTAGGTTGDRLRPRERRRHHRLRFEPRVPRRRCRTSTSAWSTHSWASAASAWSGADGTTATVSAGRHLLPVRQPRRRPPGSGLQRHRLRIDLSFPTFDHRWPSLTRRQPPGSISTLTSANDQRKGDGQASGLALSGLQVSLFDSLGTYITGAATNASGDYSFTAASSPPSQRHPGRDLLRSRRAGRGLLQPAATAARRA